MKKKPISEFPHMMEQWHPTKNPQFDVNETPSTLREKAWWKCKKCGYEWEALICTRKESKGLCPNCENDKKGPRTTKPISSVPHLIDYWDYDANPGLDPHTLTATKNMYANWKCPHCGHKWSANIHSRYYDNTACPACAGKVVTSLNNVLVDYPEIAKYYDDEAPGNPELYRLTKASTTLVFWKCPDCGHKWVQSVVDRIRDGKVRGCAFCTGAKPQESYEERYPELAKMYAEDNPKPFKELRASDRTTPFLWICQDCGYKFESTFGSMLELSKKPHKGCPACLGKVVAPLGKSIADLHPELLDEVNDGTDLYKLLPNSKQMIKWKCKECGYEWQTTAALRSMGYGNCTVCNGLKPVKGYNTVQDLFIDIAKQWSPSNDKRPDELLPSSTEWVKVICEDCGQEHSVQVKEAVAGNIKCPYCNEKKVASGSNSLDVTNPELISLWSKKNARDISTVAGFMNLSAYWDCPECGGTYSAPTSDMVSGKAYCKYCADEALLPGFNSLDKTKPELAAEWSPRNSLPMSQVKAGSWYRAYWICPECGCEHLATVKNHMEGNDSCKYCEGILPIPGKNSLKITRPDWMSEWADTNDVDPDAIFESYTGSVDWICPEGHKYSRSPALRLQDEAESRISCPYCDERAPVPGDTSLKALRPDWMSEWADTNDVDPDAIFESYTGSVDWICPEGHKYSRLPALRLQDEVEGRTSCPYCDDRQVLPGYNSLAAKHPDLMEEWEWVNNYVLADPDKISDASSTIVWWKCMEDPDHGNYPMAVSTRVLFKFRERVPCPMCKGRRRKKYHFTKPQKK